MNCMEKLITRDIHIFFQTKLFKSSNKSEPYLNFNIFVLTIKKVVYRFSKGVKAVRGKS